MVGQQVTQLDIERLSGCEHVVQAGIGWCARVRLSAFKLPVGVSGESGISRDPVLRASFGDVGAGFAGVVPPGRASCVHAPMRTECHVRMDVCA